MFRTGAPRFLLCSALLLCPGLCRGADPALRPVFWQAYEESHSAVLDSNLILAGAQARLKRLEWNLGRLGLQEARRRAREAFDEVSSSIEEFRPAAESASLDNGPYAPDERRLAPEMKANVRKAPAGTAQKIEEILVLRSRYDASRSRQALKSAQASLALIERRLGKA